MKGAPRSGFDPSSRGRWSLLWSAADSRCHHRDMPCFRMGFSKLRRYARHRHVTGACGASKMTIASALNTTWEIIPQPRQRLLSQREHSRLPLAPPPADGFRRMNPMRTLPAKVSRIS